ncbi:MAG: class I SAM-dependent methyltransferase, partial [Lacrimispora sphenoides]
MDSIDYYNKYAAKEFEETVNQDMSGIMKEFLDLLKEGDTILDLGCGSGRDSLSFYELGYDVTPLDASEEMCKLAEIHTGLEVLQM